jgi:hypothetical protein
MIIGHSFVQFESYIYLKITKFLNVNPYFLFVISLSLVVRNNTKVINIGLVMSRQSCLFRC